MKTKKSRQSLYIFVMVTNVIYLLWRLLFTLPLSSHWSVMLFGVILWTSELVSIYTALVLFWTRKSAVIVELPDISLDDFPYVDVFIATHNEEASLLYKTINGCNHMLYPDMKKVNIYVCDDKNRPEIKALAESMGVHYFGLEHNKHAKSGNFNNALYQTDAPLIATFDADMIPHSDFLMKSIPYFYLPYYEKLESGEWVKRDEPLDEQIGFIQTPQRFYNPDLFHYNLYSEGHIPNEQDFFSREVNVANNAHNAPVYTGSNTVLRRQAILEVGGFPTNTITEDFQLGVSIQEKGYRCYATTEVLSGGLTPTDFKSVIKQRRRWARGVIQSYYNLKIPFNRSLSVAQKLIFTSNYLYWWTFFRRIVYILAPILFALFDVRVVDNDFWLLLIFWIPSYFSMNRYMGYLAGNIRTQRWGEIYETILAPFMIVSVFLESIGIKARKFVVTKKTNSTKKDYRYIFTHMVLLGLVVASIIKFNYGKYGSELLYGMVINFWLLHHLINLLMSVAFFIQRPVHRQSERFISSFDAYIHLSDNLVIQLNGIDISDGGFSAEANTPLFIPENQDLVVELRKNHYRVMLLATMRRSHSHLDQQIYSFKNIFVKDNDLSNYNQIIYDQANMNLPLQRNQWYSEFDVLINILTHWISPAKVHKQETVLPYTEVNEMYQGMMLLRYDTTYAYFLKPKGPYDYYLLLEILGEIVELEFVDEVTIDENANLVYRFIENMYLDSNLESEDTSLWMI